MSKWRIYYADGSMVEGRTKVKWIKAPDGGVQAIVRFPRQGPVGWTCRGKVVRDRDLWTGDDEYDPFGWGPKYGSLIDTEAYFAIWDRACGDS